jgi:hypothetical protein
VGKIPDFWRSINFVNHLWRILWYSKLYSHDLLRSPQTGVSLKAFIDIVEAGDTVLSVVMILLTALFLCFKEWAAFLAASLVYRIWGNTYRR